MAKEFSKTFLIAAKCMRAAMQILHKNGDGMPSRQLMNEVGNVVKLSDWEKETTSKGGIRWQNVYHFTSVDYVKAGYIIKKNGAWYLTPEGEAVLTKPDTEVQELAMAAYRKWKEEHKVVDTTL
jgi:restriction system protein